MRERTSEAVGELGANLAFLVKRLALFALDA